VSIKYREFHKPNLDYLYALVSEAKIPLAMAENLLDYWEMRLSDSRDSLYHEYFEYYLFFESMNAGILSLFIYDKFNSRVLHQYGVLSSTIPDLIQEIETSSPGYGKLLEKTFDYKEGKYLFGRIDIEYEGKEYILGMVYPPRLFAEKKLHRLEKVFIRYYLPEALRPDTRFLNFYSSLNDFVMELVNPVLREKRPVTFTYFKFEEFRKYTKLTGESFATELVNSLAEEIKNHLKSEDMIYIINPREYLIVSLNCEAEIMKSRFHRMIFQIKSLILNYNVRFTTWKVPVDDLSTIWNDIAVQ